MLNKILLAGVVIGVVKVSSPLDIFYPHRIALFSGGLSTRLTPTSSPGLFTPAETAKGGEWSELAGEVKGELLLSGVVETAGRELSGSESRNLWVIWCCFMLPCNTTSTQRLRDYLMRTLYLCSESFSTNLALEGSFFRVASHVDLQSGVACKHFETELAGGLTPGCKHIFHEWI